MSYFFPPESLDSSINLKLQNSPLHVTLDKYILLSNVTGIYFSCFFLIIPLVLESGNQIRTSMLGIQTLFLQVPQFQRTLELDVVWIHIRPHLSLVNLNAPAYETYLKGFCKQWNVWSTLGDFEFIRLSWVFLGRGFTCEHLTSFLPS